MEPWQIAGLNRLESAGYLPALRALAMSHTTPVWWWDDTAPVGRSILHNGTMVFVNTGSANLAITASHVYQQYLTDKLQYAEPMCQVGNVRIELERYVIWSSEKLDIAVFKFPSVLTTGTGVTVHNAGKWPPPRLKQDDIVIAGGYPGNRRTETGTTAHFDFVTMISRVSQSSEDHASIYLNIPHSYWAQGVSIGENPDLGGISGGPVFLFRSEPIETIELAAIIYEASQEFELVFCRELAWLADAQL
jgi:hypothetical protein